MSYFIAVEDKARREHLVVAVTVAGPASVIGRFDDPAEAEAAAAEWTALELECAT